MLLMHAVVSQFVIFNEKPILVYVSETDINQYVLYACALCAWIRNIEMLNLTNIQIFVFVVHHYGVTVLAYHTLNFHLLSENKIKHLKERTRSQTN